MTFCKLPQDLDENANDWKLFVHSLDELQGVKDFDNHIPGTLGVYIATFIVRTMTETRRRYYIGQGNPKEREAAHRSEFRNCKTTIRTGKSKLYREAFLGGALSWCMGFYVHSSGYKTAEEAKAAELQLATEMREIYGDEVITQPAQKRAAKKKLVSRPAEPQ
jgi:hypothetical protein